jgi:outer membrane protein assembly factor BamB
VICTLENPDGDMYSPIAAYAFDENARMRLGWPVAIQGSFATGRVVGGDLALFTTIPLGDVIEDGQPSSEGGLVTIGPDGTMSAGARVPLDWRCCREWAVSPDGIAYGTESVDGASSITALDGSGIRTGWPITFDDSISGASFRSDGRIAVVLGSMVRSVSRVVVFDRDAKLTSSAELPIQTAVFSNETGGCSVSSPQAPVVAEDGTVIVYSELDTHVYAVDSSPSVMPGWPFDTGASLDRARPGLESEHEAGYCPAPVPPAIGRDSTLFLARENGSATVGGSLVAVGRDGRVVPGWPVELKRPGSEFWSVVVGPDGTAHALAIEPEAGGRSSATILAIAADSDVIWTRTIIEP